MNDPAMEAQACYGLARTSSLMKRHRDAEIFQLEARRIDPVKTASVRPLDNSLMEEFQKMSDRLDESQTSGCQDVYSEVQSEGYSAIHGKFYFFFIFVKSKIFLKISKSKKIY